MFPHALGQENLLRYEGHFAESPSKFDFFAQKFCASQKVTSIPPTVNQHCACSTQLSRISIPVL
jgi:hypothetical protein